MASISPPSGVHATLAGAGFAPDEFAGADSQIFCRAFLVDELALEHISLLDPDVLMVGKRGAGAQPHQPR